LVNYAVKRMLCPVCSKKETTSELRLSSEQYCPSCGTKTVYDDFVTKAEVVYDKAAFGYRKEHGDGYYQQWPVFANEIYVAWVEVIGNIYEHKETLTHATSN
jgi:RNA polymerase subunit RPABC4/transcription elongation factor Spt4